jgi:hypothetical protein
MPIREFGQKVKPTRRIRMATTPISPTAQGWTAGGLAWREEGPEIVIGWVQSRQGLGRHGNLGDAAI